MSRGVTVQKSRAYTYIMDHGRGSDAALEKGLVGYCTGRVCHGDDNIPTFGSGDALPGVEQTGNDARFSRQVIDRYHLCQDWKPEPEQQEGCQQQSWRSFSEPGHHECPVAQVL